MDKASRDDVAVFVDFENVYVSVREKFDATPNFELIMDRCEDYGRIVIARAYADWYRYPRVTSALFANGVEPMYVPTYYYDRDMGRTGRPIKNSVDIHLCIDAMRTLYTEPNIRKFVLVTGDRDFIPLVNAIRQRGKDVIIIGIGGAASAHLAQSADEFLFYEQIADLKAPQQADEPRRIEEPRRTEEPRRAEERRERPERSRPERAPKPEPMAAVPEARTNGKPVAEPAAVEPVMAESDTTEPAAVERNPFDTLVDAIKLARQRGFVVNLGSLKVVMRELDSGFHESKVKDSSGRGFGKFKDFVKEAERQGKVQIFTNGTVTEIFLPGEDPYTLSVFSEDLASEQAERELETELAQEAGHEELEPAGTMDVSPSQSAVFEELVTVDPAVAEESMQAAVEAPGETVRHIFADREWDVFRTSMSQFTEPVRFAEIFNALRGLRNQEVVELTNNELKELVKQAINRSMLQRTGRGARAYYRLSTQYRIARPDAASDQVVELVAPEAVPFSSIEPQSVPEDALNADAPPATPTSRRRARHYGVVSVETPAEMAQPAEPRSDPEALASESSPGMIVDTMVAPESAGAEAEASPEAPEAPARKPSRSRRKPANAKPAEPEAAKATAPAQDAEQPAPSSRGASQRSRKRPAAETEAGTTGETPPATRGSRGATQARTKQTEKPAAEEATTSAAKKRRRRSPSSTPNDTPSEG